MAHLCFDIDCDCNSYCKRAYERNIGSLSCYARFQALVHIKLNCIYLAMPYVSIFIFYHFILHRIVSVHETTALLCQKKPTKATMGKPNHRRLLLRSLRKDNNNFTLSHYLSFSSTATTTAAAATATITKRNEMK